MTSNEQTPLRFHLARSLEVDHLPADRGRSEIIREFARDESFQRPRVQPHSSDHHPIFRADSHKTRRKSTLWNVRIVFMIARASGRFSATMAPSRKDTDLVSMTSENPSLRHPMAPPRTLVACTLHRNALAPVFGRNINYRAPGQKMHE